MNIAADIVVQDQNSLIDKEAPPLHIIHQLEDVGLAVVSSDDKVIKFDTSMNTEECDAFIREQLPLLFEYLEYSKAERHSQEGSDVDEEDTNSDAESDSPENNSILIQHKLMWVLCGKLRQGVVPYVRPPTGNLMNQVVKGRSSTHWDQNVIFISEFTLETSVIKLTVTSSLH